MIIFSGLEFFNKFYNHLFRFKSVLDKFYNYELLKDKDLALQKLNFNDLNKIIKKVIKKD